VLPEWQRQRLLLGDAGDVQPVDVLGLYVLLPDAR
jgi:hypothetical protein